VAETESGNLNLDADNPTGHARQLVRRACGAWPDEQVSVAELLITELVANAVEHGRGLNHVRVESKDHLLHVEVSDANSAHPRVVHPPPTDEDERGRGLLLVATLASAWGARPEPRFGGKTVWFDLLDGDG
jgi:anti-sigma regulatory factor (Ser/Thr protein kinase)